MVIESPALCGVDQRVEQSQMFSSGNRSAWHDLAQHVPGSTSYAMAAHPHEALVGLEVPVGGKDDVERQDHSPLSCMNQLANMRPARSCWGL